MWSVIVASIWIFGAHANSSTVQVKCPESGQYVHVRPLTRCKEYYICNNGTAVFLECPEDSVFSSEEKMCKASGECRDLVCTGRIDGIYADPIENCNRIYACSAGRITYVQTCAKDGAQCSGNEKENNCPDLNYSTALIYKKPDICRKKVNNLYALNDCSRYVKCLNGKEVSFKICPHGRKFNGAFCVENYKCGNICTMKSDGFYADEDVNCEQYVYCKNQLVETRHQCPTGTVYDGTSCIIRWPNVCPSSKKCLGKQDGLHADYFHNCSTYFKCSNKVLVYEKSCKNGENFNGSTCVPQNMFFCQGPNLSPDCLGKKGFFVDQSSELNGYHFCAFGNKFIFKCPENRSFNGSHCVLYNQYKRPNKTNIYEERFVGYYHNLESKCLVYHFCLLDLNKVTLTCQQGEIFNGQECVKISMNICPNEDCTNKSNFYYTYKFKKVDTACKNGTELITLKCDFSCSDCNFSSTSENICMWVKKGYITDTKCRTYYVCSNYSLATSGKCGYNQVFNGVTCVNSNSCSIQQKSCQGLTNGFYHDIDSGCKKYFLCINGTTTELSCPAGKIHNGVVCVPMYLYKCPTTALSRQNVINFT